MARTVGETSDADEAPWRQTLRARIAADGVAPLPEGPVEVIAAITTGPGRMWANLWKPMIDALGPVLGETSQGPRDDRITDLGLHHHVDPKLRHDVRIEMWWAPALLD